MRGALTGVFLATGVVLLSGLQAVATERLAVIGAELVEIAHALGAGDRVVANDRHSVYPEAARKTATLGYFRTLSAEGMLSVTPDKVITTPDAGPRDVFTILKSAGLPVAVSPRISKPEEVPVLIDFVAREIGMSADSQALVASYERELKAVLASEGSGLRALFIMGIKNGTPVVAGLGTVPAGLFAAAGARNAVEFEGFKPVSREAMVGLAPDVIVMMKDRVDAAGGIPGVSALPGIRDTPAGREGNIVSEDSTLILRLGLRTPRFIEKLKTVLAKTVN